ncbi:MAG: hypothetical protein V1644_01025 [Candidatus Micrarchaeota archaeon]
MSFVVFLESDAEEQLDKLDNSVRIRILKKLKQMEIKDEARHLEKGLPYFVEEVGQYRIAFILKSETSEKQIVFIGDHKEYEKWIRSQ